MTEFTRTSRLTGKTHTLDLPITEEEHVAWIRSGEYIQSAFPQLTKGQREFLMTGITPEEWAWHFKDQG